MTIAAVDRLVIQDDAAAARLWPRLGPKVRDAYLADRDAWVVLRRKSDAGTPPSPETLASRHRTFAGWARAFHVAGRPGTTRHGTTAHPPRRPSAPAAAASPAAVRTTPAPGVEVPAPLPIATLAPGGDRKPLLAAGTTGSAAGAVAGGFVLAGLVALAARRKRT